MRLVRWFPPLYRDRAEGGRALADAVAALADYAEIEVNQAAALIRDAHAKQPTELSSPHLHLKIWGRNPDAAPRYYEIPLR